MASQSVYNVNYRNDNKHTPMSPFFMAESHDGMQDDDILNFLEISHTTTYSSHLYNPSIDHFQNNVLELGPPESTPWSEDWINKMCKDFSTLSPLSFLHQHIERYVHCKDLRETGLQISSKLKSKIHASRTQFLTTPHLPYSDAGRQHASLYAQRNTQLLLETFFAETYHHRAYLNRSEFDQSFADYTISAALVNPAFGALANAILAVGSNLYIKRFPSSTPEQGVKVRNMILYFQTALYYRYTLTCGSSSKLKLQMVNEGYIQYPSLANTAVESGPASNYVTDWMVVHLEYARLCMLIAENLYGQRMSLRSPSEVFAQIKSLHHAVLSWESLVPAEYRPPESETDWSDGYVKDHHSSITIDISLKFCEAMLSIHRWALANIIFPADVAFQYLPNIASSRAICLSVTKQVLGLAQLVSVSDLTSEWQAIPSIYILVLLLSSKPFLNLIALHDIDMFRALLNLPSLAAGIIFLDTTGMWSTEHGLVYLGVACGIYARLAISSNKQFDYFDEINQLGIIASTILTKTSPPAQEKEDSLESMIVPTFSQDLLPTGDDSSLMA
ncbi:hypothetical protein B7494_g2399 [Chlorociboria aeruginascens]|nr:hypothetical protein B7494_g2399 [Chlorociboria aeruginascens]